MSWRALFINVFTLCCVVGCAEVWEAPNIVRNPGFEIVDANGVPEAWTSYTTVSDVVHSGQRALFYENRDPARYVLASQPLTLEVGKAYEISAWIRTEDVVGEEMGATICLEWWGEDGKYLGGHYPAGVKGTSDWQHISSRSGRVPEEAVRCNVTCYLRKGMTGKAWWDDIEVKQWREPPLSTVLLEPNYRGQIYPDTQHIQVGCVLNLVDYDLAFDETILTTQISARDSGAIARTTRHRVRGPEMVLKLPVRGLAPGSYDLHINLLRRADEAKLDSEEWQLQVLTEEERAARLSYIDLHNRLIINGEPFFPLGMYWHSINEPDLALYAESAFNCLMPYGAPTREQMDLAYRYGVKVIYSVKDIYYGSTYCPEGITTIEDERRFIEQKVKEFREHPALLAWYLNDELPVTYMDRLKAHQAWLEELDPNHPTWVVLYQVGQIGEYLHTFDVIGTDPYPIPTDIARRAGTWTKMTVEAVHNRRPVWMVPQVFNWACYRKTEEAKQGLRPPTLAEMRSMTWQCITEGAKGLIYYSWFDIKRDKVVPFEEQWGYVKQVAAEVGAMIPVLLSVEPVPEITVSQRDWLHWTVRRLGKTVYLIATNDEDRQHQVTFQLPATPTSVHLRDAAVPISIPADGKLTAKFEPHRVLIYELQFGEH
ncbi:MAG: hypothetical protein ACUVX8_18475 [Candidatus Zipacnadales bacterium]